MEQSTNQQRRPTNEGFSPFDTQNMPANAMGIASDHGVAPEQRSPPFLDNNAITSPSLISGRLSENDSWAYQPVNAWDRRGSLWSHMPTTVNNNAYKTARSLSYSQGPGMPKPGSTNLDLLNEEHDDQDQDDDEQVLIDRIRTTTINDDSLRNDNQGDDEVGMLMSQGRHAPLPIGSNTQNFWFSRQNERTSTPGGGRRHSYAGENLISSIGRKSSMTQAQAPPPAAPVSPPLTYASAASGRLSQSTNSSGTPGSSSQQHQQGRVVDSAQADVDYYFTSDELGRNKMDYDYSNVNPAEAAQLISSPTKELYYVQFKCGRVDVFYTSEQCKLDIKLGDFVIVDADRGKDLGKVVKCEVTPEEAGSMKLKRHQEQQAILHANSNSHGPSGGSGGGSGSSSTSPGVTMPKQIIRFAQVDELRDVALKQQDEEKAVNLCCQKVQERGLDMTVLDAEYQFDRRKLTFFYAANHRIDFRDLVRELFRTYKTRIWMCAVNTNRTAARSNSDSSSGSANVVGGGSEHREMSPTSTVPPVMAPTGISGTDYGLFNRNMAPPPPAMPYGGHMPHGGGQQPVVAAFMNPVPPHQQPQQQQQQQQQHQHQQQQMPPHHQSAPRMSSQPPYRMGGYQYDMWGMPPPQGAHPVPPPPPPPPPAQQHQAPQNPSQFYYYQ